MNYLKTLSKEIHEVAKSKGWWFENTKQCLDEKLIQLCSETW
jgi:hypothetical protein